MTLCCTCVITCRICTTHFLEFKKILPSQREKIVKEHSSKLNDYFNADPNQNKSFLEDYYKNLCPNLIIEEVETEHYMKTYLSIIYHNENFLSEEVYLVMEAMNGTLNILMRI